jgi:hypothetical protein
MITIAMKNVQFTICAQTFDFSSKVSVVFFVSRRDVLSQEFRVCINEEIFCI